MIRARLVVAAFALVLALAALPVHAADAPKVIDVELLDSEGNALRIVGRDQVVTIRALINNTGDANTNGTLSVRFVVRNAEGMQWTHTARRNVIVAPGNETTIDYRWPAAGRGVGNHSVTINIPGAADPGITAFFDVAETSVPAGSFAERILQHYWFFGLFLVALVLVFAVAAARKG